MSALSVHRFDVHLTDLVSIVPFQSSRLLWIFHAGIFALFRMFVRGWPGGGKGWKQLALAGMVASLVGKSIRRYKCRNRCTCSCKRGRTRTQTQKFCRLTRHEEEHARRGSRLSRRLPRLCALKRVLRGLCPTLFLSSAFFFRLLPSCSPVLVHFLRALRGRSEEVPPRWSSSRRFHRVRGDFTASFTRKSVPCARYSSCHTSGPLRPTTETLALALAGLLPSSSATLSDVSTTIAGVSSGGDMCL